MSAGHNMFRIIQETLLTSSGGKSLCRYVQVDFTLPGWAVQFLQEMRKMLKSLTILRILKNLIQAPVQGAG